MGWFDDVVSSVSNVVSNTVSSVADVVSSAGKATGLSDIAVNTNLAGSNSVAGPAAAVAAAVYFGPEVLAATTTSDAAAYEMASWDAAASAAASSNAAAGITELPAGTLFNGQILQGGMSVPSSAISSGMTLADGSQVVTTYGSTSSGAIQLAGATDWWAATKSGLSLAKDTVQAASILNASSKSKVMASPYQGIQQGFGQTMNYGVNPELYGNGLTQQQTTKQGQGYQMPIIANTSQGPNMPLILIVGLAGVFFLTKAKK